MTKKTKLVLNGILILFNYSYNSLNKKLNLY